jgi:hypothetical protein
MSQKEEQLRDQKYKSEFEKNFISSVILVISIDSEYFSWLTLGWQALCTIRYDMKFILGKEVRTKFREQAYALLTP